MRVWVFKSPFCLNDSLHCWQLNILNSLWICLWSLRLLLLVNVFGQASQSIWSGISGYIVLLCPPEIFFDWDEIKGLMLNRSMQIHFYFHRHLVKPMNQSQQQQQQQQQRFYFHRHLVCPLWSIVFHQVDRHSTLMSTISALFINIILFLVWKMCELNIMMTCLQNREERGVNILLNIRLWKVSLTCENLQKCNLLFIIDGKGE